MIMPLLSLLSILGLKTVIKSEGILSLWKGVTQHAARIVPHTIATFLFLEQYYKLLSPQGEE
jgi:hypothetical protein